MLYRVLNTAWKVSVFGIFLVCIQSEFEKIRTRKPLNRDTFHAVDNDSEVRDAKLEQHQWRHRFSCSYHRTQHIQCVFRTLSNICETLRDLVPFVLFKKREKHPWRNVTFSNLESHLKWRLFGKNLWSCLEWS